MSTLDRQHWQALLALDADTLAELAGPGLLRRAGKDLAEGRIVALPAAGAFEVDGQQVRLDARGWQQAQCSCPALAWCKHKLAAILALQADSAATPQAPATGDGESALDAGQATAPSPPPLAATPEPAASSDAEAAAAALLAEIDALDPAECLRLAGSAARQRLSRLLGQIETLQWSVRPGSLRMELRGLQQTVSYLRHGGWDGMHVEGSTASQAALKLAALWALWQQRGRALPAADGLTGTDAPGIASQTSEASQQVLFDRVCEQLQRWLNEGLAHLSPGCLDALALLAVDARADGLPALAGRLRQLHADGQRLRARDDQIDEGAVLQQLAACHAWCTAMASADSRRRRQLAGGPRRFTEQPFERELLVAGAHWWTRPSGARGLSLLFWDGGEQRLRRCSLARGDGSDASFTPHSCWSAPLWPGAGSPERLLEVGGVVFRQARLSARGDLAPTHAEVALAASPASSGTVPGIDDWSVLGAQLLADLDLHEAHSPYLLLAPSRLGPLQLDELQQCFRWPLVDRNGRLLQASWPCGDQHERDLRIYQHWSELSGRKCLLLACSESPRPSLQPVSLLVSDGSRWRCHALQYSQPPKRWSLGLLGGRISRMLAERRAPPVIPRSRLHSDLLDPLAERLALQASSGRLDTEAAELDHLAQALQPAGLELAAQAWQRLRQAPAGRRPAAFLELVWMLEQCSRLLALQSLIAAAGSAEA